MSFKLSSLVVSPDVIALPAKFNAVMLTVGAVPS